MKYQKICIIGDGLAGLTTALALKDLNLQIDLFHKKTNKLSTKDMRTTAVSENNFEFISAITKTKKNFLFWPCKKINLFYEYKKNNFNFLNYKEEKDNLMYICQNAKLKNILITKLKKIKRVKLINKEIKKIDYEKNNVKLKKNNNNYYDLIILCLGGHSHLYNEIINNRSIKKNYKEIIKKKIKIIQKNITKLHDLDSYDLKVLCLGRESKIYQNIIRSRSINKDYEEIALTGYVRHNLKDISTSQFFLKEGPLAILPFKKSCFSVVWSLDRDFYLHNINNIKPLLTEKLRHIFKNNKKIRISNISSFPIHLNLCNKYHKKNTLILGEGIHAIHPVAGQGFNLILRDIKKLKELIQKNIKLGLGIKNSNILKEFYDSRNPENTITGIGIDLINTFFKKNKYVDPAKIFILRNLEKFGAIKKISKYVSNKGIFQNY